jgi:protein-arginine kinase activator protein McsA
LPKLFMSVLVMLSLSLFCMLATAEQADAPQTSRDFNHTATGFPLAGLHSTAECGSCHVGGVFKGTPRTCSGCHAKGRRVSATAMSAQHLVTTEACEVCHTNTVTFYGAKYNHAKAVPGQCLTCHNGLIAAGKAASHSSGNKATKSCDNCHRTYAWTPASWNHAGVAMGSCSTCHNGSAAPGRPANHSSIGRLTFECDSCHNFFGWSPYNYSHADSNFGSGACANCHSYTSGLNNTPLKANHMTTTSACESCHKSYSTWLGANAHTGNEAGLCLNCHTAKRPSSHSTAAYLVSCDACHTTTSWAFNHAAQQGKHTCVSCHASRGVSKHGSGATSPTSKYYNCDSCHSVNTWNK